METNILLLYRDIIFIGIGWIIVGVIYIFIGITDLIAQKRKQTNG